MAAILSGGGGGGGDWYHIQWQEPMWIHDHINSLVTAGDNIQWQEPASVRDHVNSLLHCGNNVDIWGQYSVTGTSVSTWSY